MDPNRQGPGWRLAQVGRHLGTQASHGARRGPELAARRCAARAAYQATRKKILSQRRLSKKAGWRSPTRLSALVCSMGLVLGIPSAFRTLTRWRTRTWRLSGRLPMSGGDLGTFGRARRRCAVGWASSTSGRRSACRDCFSLVDGSPAV